MPSLQKPRLAAALLVLMAGCAAVPPPPPQPRVTLPSDAVQGAGDPVRAALTIGADAFAAPRRLAGQPALAAQAVADMEYLAAILPTDARFVNQSSTLGPQLTAARAEWRAALGIDPAAPVQGVINDLYAASRALSAGQPDAAAAALSGPAFTRGGPATLAVLANLPPLRLTNAAAVSASSLLIRGGGPRAGGF